jgi:hypothetical protein
MAKLEVGKEYGRLTALRQDPDNNERWVVRCTCGVVKSVDVYVVLRGATRSCGCLRKETLAVRRLTHGGTVGHKRTAEYHAWHAMQSRCFRKSIHNYKDYGGRGITVHADWLGAGGFARFLAYIGPKPSPKHSLDRIDNNGNYAPGNVRWATPTEQMRNRRNTVVDAVVVGFALPADAHIAVGQFAREEGVSVSAWMRHAVELAVCAVRTSRRLRRVA